MKKSLDLSLIHLARSLGDSYTKLAQLVRSERPDSAPQHVATVVLDRDGTPLGATITSIDPNVPQGGFALLYQIAARTLAEAGESLESGSRMNVEHYTDAGDGTLVTVEGSGPDFKKETKN